MPDEVIVRSLVFYGANNGDLYTIETNMTKEGIIGSFYDASISTPQTTFRLERSVYGNYDFRLQRVTAGNYPANSTMTITLEFIKYKQFSIKN